MSVENVVSKHQRTTVIADELLTHNERLRNAIWRRLHRVTQVDSPPTAITQKLLECWGRLRCGDNDDLSDTRKHEGCQWLIDDCLVVHRHELVRHSVRDCIHLYAG